MKIAVVTAVAGLNKVNLYEPKPTKKSSCVDYFVFSDLNLDIPQHARWNFRKLFLASHDEHYIYRRTAKLPKIMTHYLLPEYDYYIWHDYSHKVETDPEEIIEKYLGDNDFAFFEHPIRDSWDTELDVVAQHGIDHASVLSEQKAHYNKIKIKKSSNFYACGVIVRKNNDVANKTCSLWYDHVCKFSSRDQLSLPAAIQKYQPKVTTLPGKGQAYCGNNKIIPQYMTSLREQGLVR